MWSKFTNHPVGTLVESIMCEDPRRHYHNWNHVKDCYAFLEKHDAPYSAELDLAVLFHDVVYDENIMKEARSIDKFYDVVKTHPNWFNDIVTARVDSIIVGTVNHRIKDAISEEEKWMIRADLSGLTDGVTAYQNYVKIMNEAKALYDIGELSFAVSNIDFMHGLLERAIVNISCDIEIPGFWSKVCSGIIQTKSISEGILRK